MLRTRGRKIFRDVFSRKIRTILVSTSIFIGVLGVIALLTVRDLIIRQLQKDVREDQLTMLDIDVSLKRGAMADNAGVLALLNGQTEADYPALEGISVVEGQVLEPIEFRTPDSNQYKTAELRTYSAPLEDVRLEPMRLLAGGTWPSAGEVVLEKRMAQKHNLKIGDTLIFKTLNGEVEYRVSGLVFHPYSYKKFGTTGAVLPGPEDGIYTQYEVGQAILGYQGFTRIVARYETFEQAEAHFEEFQNLILTATPYIIIFPLLENPADNGQVFNGETFGNILSLLAVVSLIVSGFLVVNVVNTIIAEQKRQIGTLKSLGATRTDTFIIYGGIALTYGVIGTLLAILPGIWLGYQLALSLAPQLDILIEAFQWSPPSVLMGTAMGLVIPILASAIPVLNGTRVSIMEAMTDLGIGTSYGQGPLAHMIGRLPLPPLLRQAISNVYQKRGRLTLTGITLMLAIGSSMGVIAMGRSLNNGVQDIFNRLDYQITILPTNLAQVETAKAITESLSNVTQANPGVVLSVQVEGSYENYFTRDNQVVAFGIVPSANDYNHRYVSGTGWDNDPERTGVVITAPMANQLGMDTGDELTLVIGGNRVTAPIIGVDAAAFDAMWFQWEQLASLSGYSAEGPKPNEYVVTGQAADQNIFAFGLDSNALNFLLRGNLDTGEIAITQALADSAGISEGDTLMLILQGQTVERTVSAVIANEVLEAGVRQLQPDITFIPTHVALLAFNDLVGVTGASLSGVPIPNAYYVRLDKQDPTIDEVDAAMDDIEAALASAGIGAELQNQVEQFTAISDLIRQYTAILSLAAVLIAAVGAIGLVTTLTITVFERQKEIGVMRSVGAGSGVVALQFLTEGLFVGFIAWLAGIPISYGLARLLNIAFRLETVRFTYPIEVLFLGLGSMALIATLASLGPSISAARKTVSDILRYQ
ncbi:MAG: ABC transporter permease [Anaerolineales bacterium]|nr:ABC transporter permease [Anaerolineales bacterium]